ncbi:hypothetical protein GCM10023213_45370 [Prosthecobacter algae]|uniref:HNH endonuclease n=2 Tax=Prosthecobacter algae TaxID=1144682 RepID=A0ABP9PPC0_9BACT
MNRCAFDDCKISVVDFKTNTILAEVCHIHAQNPGGPRYDGTQTPEQRHGSDNLIILCSSHHKIIDSPENEKIYTSDKLKEMKLNHEARSAHTSMQLPNLTEDLIHKLIHTVNTYESNSTHMDFRNSKFSAGGEGGHFGGAGGNGGVIQIIGSTNIPANTEFNASGEKGKTYGGGGGGGGSIHFRGREAVEKDIESGLKISSFFLADAARKEDLINVLGGCWSHYKVNNLPSSILINLVYIVEFGKLTKNSLIQFKFESINPNGNIQAHGYEDIPIPGGENLTSRSPFFKIFPIDIDSIGVWSLLIKSGSILLAQHDIEFRLCEPAQ